ncbi:hypothetical protein N866_02065 [Actinotalea ferrariae CF5-4]|uniref:Uncharacterized protein n=1 Tax=Actinotalea ferrariae CF5-4 TaxID=948458 RepID=A0A021W0S4_9CELL|nr:hypothetical protein [Actinotalea ferrariae]EYR64912.1 hypothetical protein N866_02065 [Actinotalea ferrariae CF5-4]
MQIDKAQIFQLLQSQGQDDKARQADRELPGTVDTDRDSGLLDKLGIDVSSLLGSLGGGKLGGLGGKLGL